MNMKEFILQTIDQFVRSPSLGLDISERNAKYFSFTSVKPLSIDMFGEIEIPEGIIEQGEIKKEQELIRIFALWHTKQPRHIRSAYITASVPEEKSFVRVIQLPKIKKREIALAIRWELEANVPIPPDQLIYDYEIIEPIDDHLSHVDVSITAFPKSIIESYVRVLTQAGFKLSALELESQAIIRSCVPELHTRKTYIVVDMGRNRTSFIIFSGDAIRFTTTIPLGGKTLEENIAKELGVSIDEAMEIKKESGLDRRVQDGKVFSSLIPALSVFVDELRRSIFFYQDHATHTHGAESIVSSVILSGGDANLLGIDTYLASALKIPVIVADPFMRTRSVLAEPIPAMSPHIALSFTTAIGLALRQILTQTRSFAQQNK